MSYNEKMDYNEKMFMNPKHEQCLKRLTLYDPQASPEIRILYQPHVFSSLYPFLSGQHML